MPFFTEIISTNCNLASANTFYWQGHQWPLVLNPMDRGAVPEGWHSLHIYLPSSLKSKWQNKFVYKNNSSNLWETKKGDINRQKLEAFLKDWKQTELERRWKNTAREPIVQQAEEGATEMVTHVAYSEPREEPRLQVAGSEGFVRAGASVPCPLFCPSVQNRHAPSPTVVRKVK